MSSAKRCILISGAGVLFVLLSGCAATRLTREQVVQNIAAFDVVWETVRDTHWDPEFNNVDWDAARDTFRPRVAAATTMPAARKAMQDLLGQLGQSHFEILAGAGGASFVRHDSGASTPQSSADEPVARPRGTFGLSIRVLGSRALVTRLRPGLPAAKAGVQSGWELVAVNEGPVAALLKRVADAHNSSSHNLASEQSFAANAMLEASLGDVLDLTFETLDGQRLLKRLTAARPPGSLSEFGHLTPTHVHFDARRLAADRIGYVTFNIFLDPENLMPAFEQALRDFADCQGIVLDLRGNPGGIGAMAMGMAGFFVRERGLSLGMMQMRDTELNFIVFPRPRGYAGKLAILVDEMSASTTEILAAGLQDFGRARVFGRRTAAAVLPSHIRDLPNGDRFQHAVANFRRSDGRLLEGVGVDPDVAIIPSRSELAAGRDPVLEAAENWILGGPLLGVAVQ